MLPPTLKELKVSDLEDLLDGLSSSLEGFYQILSISREKLSALNHKKFRLGYESEHTDTEKNLNKEILENLVGLEEISDWAISLLRKVRKG